MLYNFFITSLRHLVKNKSYALMNIFGLSVGLGCFLIIFLWTAGELRFDRFHSNADRIYRVAATFTDESGQMQQAVTPTPLGPALVQDIPEIQKAVRIDVNNAIVKRDDKQFIEDDILAVDQSFFDVFSFKLLKGNAANALAQPYSIVITESMAKKYFGEEDPLDQTLRIFAYDPDGTGADYRITGVIEDCPQQSHFTYNFLFSFATVDAINAGENPIDNWFNNGYYTYVLLDRSSNIANVEKKLPPFLEKYIGPQMKEWGLRYDYFLQPLTDIHLHSALRYELGPTSTVTNVALFSSIGLLVLILACINYINLSTAYANDRFKEVGIRKVMGAGKGQLIRQHLLETWLLAMASLVVAIAWIEISRPFYESVTGQKILGLYSGSTILSITCLATFIGILSGVYPAFVLSSFQPVSILKGQLKTGTKAALLRKSLVTIQFVITIVLFIGIVTIQKQMDFVLNKDLGFDRENLVVLNVNGSQEVISHFEAFANELSDKTFVGGIARSSSMIAGGLGNSVATAEDVNGKRTNATVFRLRVDHDFVPVFGMSLVAGRNFIAGSKADSIGGFIVNEATTRLYGYRNPKEALGKLFQYQGKQGNIIGVVKDFHYNSLKQQIEPTCLHLLNRNFSKISVRVDGPLGEAVNSIEQSWKKHFPNTVFDFSFAEEGVQKQYVAENRFFNLFIIFSVVSMALACLGLFALVSFSVESRTREIGIRKVLGATAGSVIGLLSKEFFFLIGVSTLLAMPLAYYFLSDWLETFTYRIDMTADIFLTAVVSSAIVAGTTIAIKAVRAALANPIHALRNH